MLFDKQPNGEQNMNKDNEPNAGGQGSSDAGASGGNTDKKDTVSFDTYQKTLDQLKAKARENEALKETLQKTTSDLEKFDFEELKKKASNADEALKLIEKLKREKEEIQKAKLENEKLFRSKASKQSFLNLAKSVGCVDGDALYLITQTKDKLNELEIDDDSFAYKEDSFKSLVAEIQKEKPYLFKQGSATPTNYMPTNKQEIQKTVKNMTDAELKVWLKSQGQ